MAGKGSAIAENRRARFDFHIEETFEAGISLVGTEVKALRLGKANIAESYAAVEGEEIFLINANFPIYEPAAQFNHLPTRPRKLLLKRREIDKLMGAVQRKGRTIVPLKLYFNDRGYVKLLLGVGVGKRQADKRETQKKRDWNKQKARLMKERG
ncbi:MAG: SsrA-binding protein SmpB [Acidimicrobiales bacterium]|nr:SsrA-binding protein SmpB [Hyphomonadaceae bacterium]RZV42811.1 MAG: SsrA-binding protein SmpB [Acidimicrobiales bacterium]